MTTPMNTTAPAEPAGGEDVLEINEVTRSFSGVVAVAGISLTLDSATITGMVGPNGSGKTTLLNMASGFLKPSSGTITWAGRRISGRSPHLAVKQGVRKTFQQRMCFDDLTVRENIEVAGLAMGLSSTQARRRRAEIVELLELDRYIDEMTRNVPFGIIRKLGVACAIAELPRMLLVDEPFAGLTVSEGFALAKTLRDIAELGVGICAVDHNIDVLSALCARIIVLDTGRVIADGGPEVFQDKEVIRVYLG
jgi:ABC-type branched-subunit amino acid transport system ATPase component